MFFIFGTVDWIFGTVDVQLIHNRKLILLSNDDPIDNDDDAG